MPHSSWLPTVFPGPAGRAVRACLFAAVALLTLAAPHAQQAAERALTVEFFALGPDGANIPDLRADEVTVRVDGRPRAVRGLRFIRQADSPVADPLAFAAAPPRPFGSNGIAEAGRSFIVVVDDESFRPGRERPIRSAMRAFLGSLSPRDRVSLWTTPHGGIKVNFTVNHDRVSSAMDVVSGHGPEQETGSDAACRTRNTLENLEHMLSALTGGEGPTTVILFTASLYGPRRDQARIGGPPGMCELRTEEFQRVGHAAAQARAFLYIVQPEDLQRRPTNAAETVAGVGFAPTLNPLEGMEQLAAFTGAERWSLTRRGDATLLDITRATTGYYAATIEGAATDTPGPHGLGVRVSRAGVDVRARPFVHVALPDGPAAPARSPAEMIRSGAAFPGLPLRVTAFATENDPSGQMRIVAAAEPAEPGTTLTAASIGFFDADGRLAGQVNLSSDLTVLPLLAPVVVARGTYRVRFAAVDAAGRGGAVDAEVAAEMTSAGSLRLSSLVLGLWRADAFQPRLQFSSEPVVIAYLDLIGGTAGAPVGARVELAQTLNGPPLVTTRLALEATSNPNRFTATGAIPIAALPPGDYIVRAIVGIEGQPFGRVVRALRKVQ